MPKLIPTKFSRWTQASLPLSFLILLGCLGLLALFGWLSQVAFFDLCRSRIDPGGHEILEIYRLPSIGYANAKTLL